MNNNTELDASVDRKKKKEKEKKKDEASRKGREEYYNNNKRRGVFRRGEGKKRKVSCEIMDIKEQEAQFLWRTRGPEAHSI